MNSILCFFISLVFGSQYCSEDPTFWFVKNLNSSPVELTVENLNDNIEPTVEKIIFIIHGWFDSKDSDWYPELTKSLLEKNPNWNVIQVDWSKAAAQDFFISSNETVIIGLNTGIFINQILSKCENITAEKITLVGHSLGAHVAGFTGKTTRIFGNTISKIFGLDPAYPPFNDLPCENRLCKDDTKYLSVIHTNGDVFGITKAIGHSDFYPNGGKNQPGCDANNTKFADFIEEYCKTGNYSECNDIPGLILNLCNHQRAIAYFIEAVNFLNHFESMECSDYYIFETDRELCQNISANMGNLFSFYEGIFYLDTYSSSPYSINID